MNHEKYMNIAINQAYVSFKKGDYPIGACLAKNGKIFSVSENLVKNTGDSTYHAEIELIRKAIKKQGGGYLNGAVLYTTHEPCPMCTAACVWAKVGTIVYGNSISDFKEFTDENSYFRWRVIDVPCRNIALDKVSVIGPYMSGKCKKLFSLRK